MTLRCLFVVLAVTALLQVRAGDDASRENEACRYERDRIETLERGNIEEVWTLLEEDDGPDTESIADPEEHDYDECRAALIAALARAISRNDDPRIPARVIDELPVYDAPLPLAPVFEAALRHGSADVRRHAAGAIERAGEPELSAMVERRFLIETDARVRPGLIAALAATESRRFLPELRHIARSDEDAATRRAALDAVMSLPDADSVELLEGLALDDSDEELGLQAVESLARWLDIPAAHRALRTIGRRGPGNAARIAVQRFAEAGDGDVDALVEIANARSAEGDGEIRNQAISLVDILDSGAKAYEHVTFSCGIGRGRGPTRMLPLVGGNWPALEQPQRYVAPQEGRASSRCWDAPGFMWLAEVRPRVPAGEQLVIMDTFTWAGSPWFAVISPQYVCWIPGSELVEKESPATENPTLIEMDIPVADASSAAARKLERLGWLSWLEFDDTLGTARLEADPSKRAVVEGVVQVRRQADAPAIALLLDRWLYAFAQGFAADDDLGDAVPDSDPRWPEPPHDEPDDDEP